MTASGPLLVPIRLDAVAITKVLKGPVRRPAMAYDELRDFATAEPRPFAGVQDRFSDPAANRGVYLMWSLPAALRHGTQPPGGTSSAVEFPLVPNRWLVVRSATPASDAPAKAWILESDILGGTSPFADQTSPTATQPRIGRSVPVTADKPWVERNPETTFLTALGPGDPAFAAYQPGNQDVFSIHDNLAEQGITRATLHYFVVGWYADPQKDVLADWTPGDPGGGYAGLLERLGWTAPDHTGRTAKSSLCHGVLLGVAWDDDHPPESARESATPQVALGATSTDALTAFLKAEGLDDSSAELLEAFALDQLGVLQQPGGEAILTRALHAARFGSGAGGLRWQITDRPTANGARPAPPDAAQLTAEQALLAELNRDQEELDAKRRLLASLQRELYELWWKQGYASQQKEYPYRTSEDQFSDALDATDPTSPAGRVQQLQGDTQADLDPDTYARKHQLAATRQLTATLAPRFSVAQDPVLLVAGLGHDLVMDPAATLACRYGEDVVAAIAARQRGASVVHTAADVAVPEVAASGLAREVGALLAEFALLQAFDALDPAGFGDRVEHAAQAADQASFATARSGGDAVLGRLPGLPVEPWRQAWLPLYLEWEVAWYPLPYETQDGVVQWSLDGGDFAFAGKTTPTSGDTISGRALLTPGLAFAFRSRLEQYIAGDPSNAAVKALDAQLQAISGWDFLSQTLDGLMTQLAWRDPQAARAPDGDVAKLVDDQHQHPPQSRGADRPHYKGQVSASTFEGMRAGQLALRRISIVDRFGQTLDAPVDGVAVAANLKPRGTVATGACAELPPRLLQGARLRFTAETLGGFLVPDHIDQALAAHDPAGALLGELRLDGDQVIWDPVPSGANLGDLAKSRPELAGVLGAVRAAGAGAFENFLTTIDEMLWTIDPLAGGEDEYQSALAGRAMALVGAKLSLEHDGEPVRDPSWPRTFDPQDPRFVAYDFPVALGSPADREDGLVGYFVEKALFHAVRVPHADDLVSDPAGFVATAGTADIRLRFDGTSVARVTLLVDPRGKVQAHTGLLPTTVLELPPFAPALQSLAYRAGPLLPDQATVPLMPAPTASGRTWSWVDPDGQTQAFPPVDDRARFSTLAAIAREGLVRIDPEERPR